MTLQQDGYEKMSLVTVIFSLANSAITATLNGYGGYLTTVQNTNTSIQAAMILQENDKKGITAAKTVLKELLVASSMEISRRVLAFATIVNNTILMAEVNYSNTKLMRCTDLTTKNRCQTILTATNANAAALVAYGVTPVMITGMQTALTNFTAAIPTVRVATTDTEQATTGLVPLYKTLVATFAKMDLLVEMVKLTQPSFYAEYKSVRKVVITGAGSLSLKLQATNAETGEAIPNVTITITPVTPTTLLKSAHAGKPSIVLKTAAKGGTQSSNMPQGNYIFTAEKPGLKLYSNSTSVVDGEMTHIEVVMEKM